MRLPATALAAALLLLLAGCGDDPSSTAVAGAPASGSASPDGDPTDGDPTDGGSDPTTSPSPGGDETTAPGTELSYGDTARVDLEGYDGQPAIAEWTVTGVEPGKATDNGPFSPYRINVTLTAVTDLSKTILIPGIDFDGLDAQGETTIFNTESGCTSDVDVNTLKPGESVELCIAVTAFEAGDLTGVQYDGGAAYSDQSGDPIVWKP